MRLREIRSEMDISQKKMAILLGVSLMTYQRYERDENVPPADFCASLCQKRDISIEWLILGTGPMRKGSEPATAPEQQPQPQTIEGYPPFIPILVKSKILSTILSNEASGRVTPIKVFADEVVGLYLDDYHKYLNGELELPTTEASIEVIESLRPSKKTTTIAS